MVYRSVGKMQRDLSTFQIPQFVRLKLSQAGFVTVDDVINLKPSELDKEINIGLQAAVDLLHLVREEAQDHRNSVSGPSNASAWDLLNDVHLQQPIVTFSQQLDCVLGGGVPLGKLTEFCGAPGIGKTQVCMQLAVDVQMPECFDGIGGEAVYVDTEGSFVVERLVDIAEATVKHCQFIADSMNLDGQQDSMKVFNVESILNGIHYFRCHDHVQLIAVVRSLDTFIREHCKVKLIIVDSVAFHFRQDFDDFLLRSRLLNALAQTFNRLSSVNKLAVVVTNQMTTQVGDQSSQLVPALGESWAHVPAQRVILYWQDEQRHAIMYKSAAMNETDAVFQITTGGIRDVVQTARATTTSIT